MSIVQWVLPLSLSQTSFGIPISASSAAFQHTCGNVSSNSSDHLKPSMNIWTALWNRSCGERPLICFDLLFAKSVHRVKTRGSARAEIRSGILPRRRYVLYVDAVGDRIGLMLSSVRPVVRGANNMMSMTTITIAAEMMANVV
jgi:hypothetical protein